MATLPPLTIDNQTRIQRAAQYQQTDRQELFDILDEALVAQVAIVRDELPIALPVGFARDDNSILIHGSTGSDFFRRIADGAPVCVNVTLLDGLIFARSLFDSSMRYRAVVIHGVAEEVQPQDKESAVLALSRHLMPGREEEVRPITKRELAATMVLRIPLDSVSVKVNRASTTEELDDGEDRNVWAGELPLRMTAGTPMTSTLTQPGTAVPDSVRHLIEMIDGRR